VPSRILVVGAGLAGAGTAAALRAGGFTGRVTLLGAERHRPYDRPPLSKAVLSGAAADPAEAVALAGLDLSGVEVLLDRPATGLRPGVVDTDAGPLDWDGLVLATGATPVRLPGDPGQRVLRTLDDAVALRDRLVPGRRLAVVGAGWIGAEVATAARARGAAVTVVEAAATPLAAALGEEVGARTAGWYAEAGVDLRLGCPVRTVEPDGLLLAGCDRLAADVVLVGVGVRPELGWLAGAGLDLERGLLVDEHLAASWPGVVAAGDCAAWWSRRFGTRLRVEHWDDALHAPAVAAATLLGRDAVHDPVPYFWSEQFGRMVQFAGHRAAGARLVWRGDPDTDRTWAAGWLAADGRLTALLTVDRPRDLVQGRRLIAAGAAPDPARLADPGVPVKSA
jgi:3-phenylpropionate/trans-cinnamate dioxygenase ferredoxin reductase subunit